MLIQGFTVCNMYLFLFFLTSHRPIKGICGFTREIIVGLIANLATRELRQKEYQKRDLPREHPEPRQQMMLRE